MNDLKLRMKLIIKNWALLVSCVALLGMTLYTHDRVIALDIAQLMRQRISKRKNFGLNLNRILFDCDECHTDVGNSWTVSLPKDDYRSNHLKNVRNLMSFQIDYRI